ncbi:MAG: hypothetical protein IJP79_00950 [Paludibacteraceae bacterium]|nr:hypothetical protein [Paludibacteraceae bacterium]
MKQKKCILVIDDKSQSTVIKGIESMLTKDFDLDFIPIRTGAAELKKNDSEDLDVDKLKTEIETKIKDKHIHIALSDFDLECPYFTGLDAVHMVHEIRENVNFFIYSGNWNKVIESVVGKDYQNASIEELVNGVNKLIKAQIINCIDRIDYQETLIEYLKKNKGNTIEHRLAILLRAHGDLKFESGFPKFKGKTFNEIADMIVNHSDARTDEWIDTLLTQTIAYLVKVNQ